VDAYPVAFTGTVDQVRIASSTVQNVVTYPVMVRAGNPDEKLFPGMTANISCIISERTNVLRVSNTALRFKPEKPASADKSDKKAPESKPDKPAAAEADGKRKGGPKGAKLWVQNPDSSLRPLRVTTGITDGTWTEVSGDEVVEGLDAVTGVLTGGAKNAVVNPFMPTPTTPQTRPPRM